MLSVDQNEQVNWFISLDFITESFVKLVDKFVKGFTFVIECLFELILILDAAIHNLWVAWVYESNDEVQEDDQQEDLLDNPETPNEFNNYLIKSCGMMVMPVMDGWLNNMANTIFKWLKDISCIDRSSLIPFVLFQITS